MLLSIVKRKEAVYAEEKSAFKEPDSCRPCRNGGRGARRGTNGEKSGSVFFKELALKNGSLALALFTSDT